MELFQRAVLRTVAGTDAQLHQDTREHLGELLVQQFGVTSPFILLHVEQVAEACALLEEFFSNMPKLGLDGGRLALPDDQAVVVGGEPGLGREKLERRPILELWP